MPPGWFPLPQHHPNPSQRSDDPVRWQLQRPFPPESIMTNRAGRRRRHKRHKERSARSWIVTWLTPTTHWRTLEAELQKLEEARAWIHRVKRALWAATRFPRF